MLLIRPNIVSIPPQPESREQKSFLDLPPEIRLRIYHHLFDGQEIFIRSEDDPIEQKRLEYKLRVRCMEKEGQSLPHELYLHQRCPCYEEYARYRAVGSNIIFASKTCSIEAIPILLAGAIFDVDIDAYTGRPPHQGIPWLDIPYIRHLMYSRKKHRPCLFCTYPSETVVAG